ncbi:MULTISPECIES: transposase, partial [unclassified Streptomyces]|uniref:IS701 family transposase n=1 Tax=unclassified Streptomyces TaxID=2593676 RepID=UPI0004C37124
MTHAARGADRPSILEEGHRVAGFADQLFTHLPRADQRRWAAAYLLGLLAVSGRKSVRSLAAAITDSPTASQSLHRFINASPWDWQPVRSELRHWVEQRTRPKAWTVGVAVLPKRGDQSCGVHRRFVPALGRTINCQVGIGQFLATSRGQIPVDWRLHLPTEWSEDKLRRRTRIPEGVHPLPAWAQVLDLADTSAAGPSPALPLVADLREYESDRLLLGLRQRAQDFVVAVPDTLAVQPPAAVRPSDPAGGGSAAPVGARRFLETQGELLRSVLGAGHLRPSGLTRVVTGLVRLPRGPQPQRFYRLFAEVPRDGEQPAALWLTTLVHLSMEELLELAALSATTPRAMRRLEGGFGLQDFEGRSYPGWHRHVTLVSAACAFQELSEVDPAGPSGVVSPARLIRAPRPPARLPV